MSAIGHPPVGPPSPQDFRKRLVAPMAGFLSAGLEISLVWPSEYAKTQLQVPPPCTAPHTGLPTLTHAEPQPAAR